MIAGKQNAWKTVYSLGLALLLHAVFGLFLWNQPLLLPPIIPATTSFEVVFFPKIPPIATEQARPILPASPPQPEVLSADPTPRPPPTLVAKRKPHSNTIHIQTMAKPSQPQQTQAKQPPSAETKTVQDLENHKKTDTYTPPKSDVAYLNNPKPTYPAFARRRELQGVVLLNVMVDISGLPLTVTVKQGSGHRILDESALQAVKQWHFVPAQRGGIPVQAVVTIPIRFQLKSG